MKKFPRPFRLLFVLILPLLPAKLQAQDINADSLKHAAKTARTSSAKVKLLIQLTDYYDNLNGDSCIFYGKLAMTEAFHVHDLGSAAYAESDIAETFMNRGNYVQSLKMNSEELAVYQRLKDSVKIANAYHGLALLYSVYDISASYQYHNRCKCLAAKIHDYLDLSFSYSGLCSYFIRINRLDSALFYARGNLDLLQRHYLGNQNGISHPLEMLQLSSVYHKMRREQAAIALLKEALQLAITTKDRELNRVQLSYANALMIAHKPDSALSYAKAVLKFDSKNPALDREYYLYSLLAGIFGQKKQYEEALKYQQMATKMRDSIFNISQLQQVSNQIFNEKQRQADLKNATVAYQSKVKFYAAIAIIIVALLIVTGLLVSFRKQQKANKLLKVQKDVIEQQRDETNQTLAKLKSTQTQLIQSEKMASLGELTAGIAHEIQNPLNFVNNFSEVNEEMLEELKAESAKPKAERNEVLETELINDLIDNQRKIKHHGKRADFIVKGMLEHSRTSTGERQVTDINVLADEFLKLSYHGLRAKDKSFNAELITNFDHKLPRVNVVQQDIGRALINLFSNAFYAVNEKKKIAGADYKPAVEISTAAENGSILIKVKDNGNGIPDAIKDKIMQPFFTTKPTGEGTGLGLSLSYDIVVKGHGGTIQVDSKDGQGSEFMITLPAKYNNL